MRLVRGYQSQVKWAGRVPRLSAAGYAYAWSRALHSRFAGRTALRAGELSRGVGLRGFEIGLRNRTRLDERPTPRTKISQSPERYRGTMKRTENTNSAE